MTHTFFKQKEFMYIFKNYLKFKLHLHTVYVLCNSCLTTSTFVSLCIRIFFAFISHQSFCVYQFLSSIKHVLIYKESYVHWGEGGC